MLASAMGCSLVTASDETELADIAAAATAQMYTGPRAVLDFGFFDITLNIFMIGLIRPTDGELITAEALGGGSDENDPEQGGTNGPWGWFDDCTPYNFNPFVDHQPDNFLRNERVGGIFFEDQRILITNFNAGDVVDIPDVGFPALYECCIDE